MSTARTKCTVLLTARLGKDAEMKYFPDGRSICKITACTEHSFRDKNSGEFKKTAEWHNIIVQGAKAKDAARLRKGQLIDVNGRHQTRKFEHNGEKRFIVEVITWEARPVGEPPREVNGNVLDDSSWT